MPRKEGYLNWGTDRQASFLTSNVMPSPLIGSTLSIPTKILHLLDSMDVDDKGNQNGLMYR